ncbi:MAG: UDP-N-acetylmuramoyl-tripeptide--D-alanyl-D-alanine ligase [Erysipelotrichaceae bacterium]|nr:UDP-N-acetylmuramoyl-tripeptide--D-alanyl-D-alanine ligase [Erysipelotrichaceae bacterium]
MNDFLIILLYLCVYLSLCFVFCKHALQMFQQNHYELYRYSKWLFNKNNIHFSKGLLYSIVILTIGTLLKSGKTLVCIFITLAFAIWMIYEENKAVYVKDLVLTARVKRQIAVLLVLLSLFILAGKVLPADILGVLCIIMSYLMIYPMALLTSPMEEMIKKRYENEARMILAKNDQILKIGITGSYGKTSTKNIVNDIIADNKFTLITPASYNTPMGITRTIREMLKPIHEVFVCEMGADKVGDIGYLMDFVKPKFGVVTSIGPQHLNTFHSMENIIEEKMKEIEMLPLDGTGFINLDNEYIASYQIKNHCEVISVGIENKDADLVAEKITYSKDGSKFSVKIDGKTYKFVTSLLGKHNITNILIGIAIARKLGIDMKDIVKNVKNINQVEHRLEVKKINNFTFIDDAFNSNPVGSKMALDVLEMMPGRRVIVTPGMIDLGEKEEEINREFGRYMIDKADDVILVGEKQTKSIKEGLLESGFDEEHIVVFKTVREAFDHVYRHFSSRDTILLENDLPDAFNV